MKVPSAGSIASLLRAALRGLVSGGWKLLVLRAALIAFVFGGIAFAFVWAGFTSISAAEGHWPISRWVLHFAMRNAVRTQSLNVSAPVLDNNAPVLRGAGHYATGCAPCHGAPGEQRSPIVRRMTPEPPFLPSRVGGWDPEQLFWIVKNGIKFTAMPAWVAQQREDEVWAVVAFIKQLPELSPDAYRALAYGPAAPARDPDLPALGDGSSLGPVLENCSRCHGRDGNGRGPGAFPKLAGQKPGYIRASLEAYAKGERFSGIMQPVAEGLGEGTVSALAEFYAGLDSKDSKGRSAAHSPPKAASGEQSAAIARGKAIATDGLYGKGIPACSECHSSEGAYRNPIYPRLDGQYAGYLVQQLELFKAGERGGTPYNHIMNMVAKRLSQQQIDDVAAYYAALE